MADRRQFLVGALGAALIPGASLALPKEPTVDVLRRNVQAHLDDIRENKAHVFGSRDEWYSVKTTNESVLKWRGETIFGSMEPTTSLANTVTTVLSHKWTFEHAYDGIPPGFTSKTVTEYHEALFAEVVELGYRDLIARERQNGFEIRPYVPVVRDRIIVNPYTMEPEFIMAAVYERVPL